MAGKKKPARPIADGGGEPAKAAIVGEAAFEHTAENVRIDIAAAERQDNFFAFEFRNEAGETTSTSTPWIRRSSTASRRKAPATSASSRGYDVVRTQTRTEES